MPSQYPGLFRVCANLAVVLLAGFPRPAAAFIDVFRPETLGAVCDRAQSITVVRLEKLNKEKGILIYRKVKDLKGKLPRDSFREHLGTAHLDGERKHYLDWAAVDKTAVVYRYENRLAICIGDQWTVADAAPPKDEAGVWTFDTRTEPCFLRTWCGDSDKLASVTEDLLAGKEAIVPTMAGERDKELRQRNGKLQRSRASLKRKDYNPQRDLVEEEGDGK